MLACCVLKLASAPNKGMQRDPRQRASQDTCFVAAWMLARGRLIPGVRLRVESNETCVVAREREPLLPRFNGCEEKLCFSQLA